MNIIKSIFGFALLVLLLVNCKKDENEKPVISIVLPENGHSIYKGDSIEIIVNANDPDGLVETVDFVIDDNLVYQSKIAPYKYIWHTDEVKGGQHNISAIAFDNKGESTSDKIIIEIQTVLPDIQTSPISFIGTTLLTSGGNVTSVGIPAIHSRGLCWNTTGNPTLVDSYVIDDGDADVFDVNITGLKLDTKYYIRAFVENTDTIIYGVEYSKTTANKYYSEIGTFIDSRDTSQYNWVKIGNQIWMVENLKYLANGVTAYVPNYIDLTYGEDHFYTRPIKDIPAAKSSENYKTYGCLYLPSPNICPTGWHIPSSDEWQELINFLGGEDVSGGILKESGITHWNEPNSGASNLSQFLALPAGWVNAKYSDYYHGINTECAFFTSDKRTVVLNHDSEKIIITGKEPYSNGWYYYSIRCVKD